MHSDPHVATREAKARNGNSSLSIAEIDRSIVEAEAAKVERQRQREEKAFYSALKRRRAIQERLVAPILLLATMVISAILYILRGM